MSVTKVKLTEEQRKQLTSKSTGIRHGYTQTDAIKAAVLVEREACAKVCDEQAESPALASLEKYRANFIAEIIRARGQAR